MTPDDAAPIPCPTCGDEVPAVVVRRDPEVVTMRSCNRCDRRWWTADGEPADPLLLFRAG